MDMSAFKRGRARARARQERLSPPGVGQVGQSRLIGSPARICDAQASGALPHIQWGRNRSVARYWSKCHEDAWVMAMNRPMVLQTCGLTSSPVLGWTLL